MSFGGHRGAGKCLGGQLAEPEVVADQRLGVRMIDAGTFRTVAASCSLERAAVTGIGNAAIIRILPVASTDAQCQPSL